MIPLLHRLEKYNGLPRFSALKLSFWDYSSQLFHKKIYSPINSLVNNIKNKVNTTVVNDNHTDEVNFLLDSLKLGILNVQPRLTMNNTRCFRLFL